MITYNVALANPDELRDPSGCPHSFGTGKYLEMVKADSMDQAVEILIATAKRKGYYGHDWRANIIPLDRYGQRQGRALSWMHERMVELWDGGRRYA